MSQSHKTLSALDKITSKAFELGFIAAGFSPVKRPLFIDEFKEWINAGKNAGMSWLERNIHIREDPKLLIGDAVTVISLAYPYSKEKPATPEGYTVSRYSRPDMEDYHKTLKYLCAELIKVIEIFDGNSRSRICVDSAPVMERSFGLSSGIGFVGRNNMLIIPDYGSYFYLAEIITTAFTDISEIEPLVSQCGACTLCMDSCPTKALEGPYSINPSRCLSYMTIESGDNIDSFFGKYMGDCFLGCDICQEVCPFNKEEKQKKICLPSTDEILCMTETEFRRLFGKTALSRPGLLKLKNNLNTIKVKNQYKSVF